MDKLLVQMILNLFFLVYRHQGKVQGGGEGVGDEEAAIGNASFQFKQTIYSALSTQLVGVSCGFDSFKSFWSE